MEIAGKKLRDNTTRAKYTILTLRIVLAINVVALVANAYQFFILKIAEHDGDISQSSLNNNDLLQQTIGAIRIVVYLLCAISFIRWFRRAYKNLHQLKSHLAHREIWASIGWFIPVFNLFQPYQIMMELYTNTSRILSDKEHENLLPAQPVAAWWALWITTLIAEVALLCISINAYTIQTLEYVTMLSALCNILELPLCFLAIKVVGNYRDAEQRLRVIS